jgi:putative ATPase
MSEAMNLFNGQAEMNKRRATPLAARMRPRTLEEYAGQEQIIGRGRLLRRAIEADQLSSLIFYGPPGVGKTSLARVIANSTSSDFRQLSAVGAGIGDIRAILSTAKENLELYGMRTVLFIDEIHRFNKAQQDALLPAVEDGTIILIGATTENPYFEVNGALLSRSRIFRLLPLEVRHIRALLLQALQDKERGLGNYNVEMTDEALQHIAEASGGDARTAYNALELAVLTTAPGEDGVRHITLDVAAESIQQKALHYDKQGDNHYDVISAFIKSMRGSDPNAVLHYLARMIRAGEQPEFICRRIIICAAEDVGLADPKALQVAVSCMDAVHFVGWPEARIPLAMAALYVANAPKSNSAIMGIDAALADVDKMGDFQVPSYLRDAHYPGAKELGHGIGYKYVHDFGGYVAEQQYLPNELKNKQYYHKSVHGAEALPEWYLRESEPEDE